ncbi:MAG: hypothetical protein WA133_02410 [Syntrophales bacterium]
MDEYDLLLKLLIDKQYTLAPFYGSRKMTEQLRRDGYMVNSPGFAIAERSTLYGEVVGHRQYLPMGGAANREKHHR